MGAFGAEVVPADARVLTHCNAGALATAGYGTALGVIRGAVAAYLLLGLTFAFAYEMITLKWPDAFTFANARPTMPDALISHFVYFSFVTLTTLGYGDVTPNHPIARSLVTVEALIGQLFPAILLARLVSLELLHEERRAAEEIRR